MCPANKTCTNESNSPLPPRLRYAKRVIVIVPASSASALSTFPLNKTNKGATDVSLSARICRPQAYKWESFAARHAIRGMARLIIPRIVRARHPRAHPCVFSYTEPGDPRESCTTLFNSILFRSCYPATLVNTMRYVYPFLSFSLSLGCRAVFIYDLTGIDDS